MFLPIGVGLRKSKGVPVTASTSPAGSRSSSTGAAARNTPVLADVAPIGRHTIAAFDAAGGVHALRAQLEPATAPPAVGTGNTDGGDSVIRPLTNPVTNEPALVAPRGNLAPDGAILKTAAARPHLLTHTGPAVVFHGYADMMARIDDLALTVTTDSVLILTRVRPTRR